MQTTEYIKTHQIVNLPKPLCTFADHSCPAYTEKQVTELLASLGYLARTRADQANAREGI